MFEGRVRKRVTAAALVLGCALLAASLGVTAASGGGLKLVFVKARVRSDGIVTPGQLETIAISRMPRRTKVRVFIESPPTTLQCGEFYFCHPVRVSRVPGSPRYRTNGKGRALLTFVMPSSYFIEPVPIKRFNRRPVTFAEGQSVHLDVEGSRRRKRKRLQGFGFSRAIVQLPPSQAGLP